MFHWLHDDIDTGHELSAPCYTELSFSFAARKNLYDFAIHDCNLSPDHPVAGEVKSHYIRSRLFLNSLVNAQSLPLLNEWCFGYQHDRQRSGFLRAQAGLAPINHFEKGRPAHLAPPGENRISGSFQLSYHMYEMGVFHRLARTHSGRPYFPPCPARFWIFSSRHMMAKNCESSSYITLAPGVYQCLAGAELSADAKQSAISLIVCAGAKKLAISASDFVCSCQSGTTLIIAISLFGLPTHIVGRGRPEWARNWSALENLQLLSGFDRANDHNSQYAKDCDHLWRMDNSSQENMLASWLHHPVFGSFPDAELYKDHKARIDFREVFN